MDRIVPVVFVLIAQLLGPLPAAGEIVPDFANSLDLTNGAGEHFYDLDDLDGDGDIDIARWPNISSGPPNWYENLGGGMFGPRRPLDGVYPPFPDLTVDLNGDGTLDSVSLTFTPREDSEIREWSIVTTLNRGNESLDEPVVLGPLFESESSYEGPTADFDRDGFVDLLVVPSNLKRDTFPPERLKDPLIFWGTEGATFVPQPTNLGRADWTVEFVDDLDGDGDLDLLALEAAGYVFVENLGGRQFATGRILPSPADYRFSYQVDHLDLNGDGRRDLVHLPDDGRHSWSWSENLGNAEFAEWVDFPFTIPPLAGNWRLQMSDDLAPAVGDDPLSVLFYGKFESAEGPVNKLFTVPLDPALANGIAIEVDAPADLPAGAFAGDYRGADLNGDSRRDFVLQAGLPTRTELLTFFSSGFAPTAYMALSRADGGFDLQALTKPALGGTILLASDFTGDGLPDLIAGYDPDGYPVLFENDGRGGIRDRRILTGLLPALRKETQTVKTLQSVDLDSDGDLDLVVVYREVLPPESAEGLERIELNTAFNDGTGRFTVTGNGRSFALPFFPDYRSDHFAIANWDGDQEGKPDLLFFRGDLGGWYRIALNQDGLQGPSELFATVAEEVDEGRRFFVPTIDVGDFEGDGDLDLLAAAPLSDLAIYLNNASGQAGEFKTHENRSGADSQFFDLDSDGDLDVLYRRFGGVCVLNNIAGELSPGREFADEAFLGIVDLDGDGTEELLTVEVTSYPHRMINAHRPRDDGSLDSSFSMKASRDHFFLHSQTQFRAWVDWDGDGDADCFESNWATVRFFRNRLAESRDPVSYWATDFQLGGVHAAAEADPDEDGLNNLGEMGFGSNPNNPADPEGRWPTVSLRQDSTPVLRFHRRMQSPQEDLLLSFVTEWSRNLEQWEPGPAGLVVTETSDGYEIVEAGPPNALQGANTLFARVRIVRLP